MWNGCRDIKKEWLILMISYKSQGLLGDDVG